MNMLFNTEKPRFDSHLQSARLHTQRAAGASEPLAPATQPESGVGCRHFDFGGSRGAYATAGRERLGSRFLPNLPTNFLYCLRKLCGRRRVGGEAVGRTASGGRSRKLPAGRALEGRRWVTGAAPAGARPKL